MKSSSGRPIRRLLWLLGGTIALSLGACTEPAPDSTVVAATNDSVSTALEGLDSLYIRSEPMLDDLPEASLPEEDPFRSFGFGESTVAQTTTAVPIRLRILNASRETAIIQADAGAGIVILDTLAAGDSIQLKLESRADSIQLSALRLSGALLGSEWVRQGTEEQRAVFP